MTCPAEEGMEILTLRKNVESQDAGLLFNR